MSRVHWIAGTVLAGAVACLCFWPAKAPTFPVPVPNGYDDFLAAAERLGNSVPPAKSGMHEPDPEEIRAWMRDHEDVFTLVRRGISKECGVPIRASSDWLREHAARLQPRQSLAHCLVARAEFAGSEGRSAEMFHAYLEAFQYAKQCSRGGLCIDYRIHLRAEALVLRSLTSSIVLLDPRQCTEALRMLQRGMAELEDPAAVLQRDRDLTRAIGGRPAIVRRWAAGWGKRIRRSVEKRSLEPLLESDERLLRALVEQHRARIGATCAQLKVEMDAAMAKSPGMPPPKREIPAPTPPRWEAGEPPE